MNRSSRFIDSPRLQAIAVVVIGLLALSSLVLYSVFSRSPGNLNSTSTSQQPSADSREVGELIGQLIDGFNNRNLSALTRFYGNTSTVYWSGVYAPGEGRYHGSDVPYLLSFFLGGVTSLHMTSSNLTTNTLSPGMVNATFSLVMKEESAYSGPTNATIGVQQQWVKQSGVWHIQRESWNYLTWESPCVRC